MRQFSANGGRGISNEVILDGSPQTVMDLNQPAYIPMPEAAGIQCSDKQSSGDTAATGSSRQYRASVRDQGLPWLAVRVSA
jgi:hypothetical protein